MKTFALATVILILSFILYQALVIIPREKMEMQQRENNEEKQSVAEKKQKLLDDYEECKRSAFVHYEMNWLRACNNQTPLKPDCKKIFTDDYPWSWHYLYHIHIKNNYNGEYTKDGYNKYLEFSKKKNDCSCKTLPGHIANSLNTKQSKSKAACLQEFETMSKILP